MVLSQTEKEAWRLYHERGIDQGEIGRLLQMRRDSVCKAIRRANDKIREVELACALSGGRCQEMASLLAAA